MASTPSNRLRLTPSNSPFFPRPSRSPIRGRALNEASHLSLKRVVGTTCSSPTGFDVVNSSFAYIAGGAVVVVNVDDNSYKQRFYRARPTAVPVFATSTSPLGNATSTPTSTPKANDSRNRMSLAPRDSPFGASDWGSDSPGSRTWTSRERIKAATCVSLSREGKFLAVGETGYSPRVLIFSLEDHSSDTPLVSISEHTFGVNAVAWSPDSRYLASLGAANDGFLYIWKIDPRTGAARLYQQNRCTSYIRGMLWIGNSLVTLGVRHVKIWRVEEEKPVSPTKQKFSGESASPAPPQRTLPGRNVLLGSMIEATFSCAAAIDQNRAIICSETGDICLFDDSGKQMKLSKVLEIGFTVHCVGVRDRIIYIGGLKGNSATLDLDLFLNTSLDCRMTDRDSTTGLLAMGFLANHVVSVDAKKTISVGSLEQFQNQKNPPDLCSAVPGPGEPIIGIGKLEWPGDTKAAFYTWSSSGSIISWGLDGKIKSSFVSPMEQVYSEDEPDLVNQITVVRAATLNKYFITGDKLGILRVIDAETQECKFETKAHTSNCQYITAYEDETKFLMASSARDRTAQLFHRTSTGSIELFQTLEFVAKVAQILIPSSDRVITCSLDKTLQIFDLVSKEGDTDIMAAIPKRVITLKASPTSMAMAPDMKSIHVAQLDRSICLYDLTNGKLLSSFKCIDEGGVESVVLDSLSAGDAVGDDPAFILGASNTDKSIRVYNASTGSFLDREWGHTEGINGVTLVEDDDGKRTVVSVGSDGTIMLWALDLQERFGSASRDPSPVKDVSISARPPLRRILSKAELAEFQRPSSAAGRKSPPRTLRKRPSLYSLSSSRTPIASTSTLPTSPSATVLEETPTRRTSADIRAGSPPASPKSRVTRRPSLPVLNSQHKKSSSNLRAFGSLNMATEQACRTLRAYRKKLTSTDPVSDDVLAELDQELRLTAVALGDRAIRSKAMSESVLNGLLDQYSERLVTMLDEKLRLSYPQKSPSLPDPDSPGTVGTTERRHSSGGESTKSAKSSTESP